MNIKGKTFNAVLFIMLAWAIVGIIQIIVSTPQEMGARDFHSYWYYGHFVLQRIDPYRAFIENLHLKLPIYYIDGKVVIEEPVAQPHLPAVPANTAPIILLLSPLSLLSWPVAKGVWLFINLMLVSAVTILLMRLDLISELSLRFRLLTILIFCGLAPTRVVVSGGQTTLLIFFFMLLALIYAWKKPTLSGITLGFALSKYSLALPVFLFLVYKRRLKAIFISLIIQLVGLGVISLWTKSSPISILSSYLFFFNFHSTLEGIHLSAWVSSGPIGFGMVILLSLSVFLWMWLVMKNSPSNLQNTKITDFHILTILSLWSLWVAYHRKYDAILFIFFIALISYGLSNSSTWRISNSTRTAVIIFLFITLGTLSIPGGGGFEKFLPQWLSQRWSDFLNFLTTLVIFSSNILTLWLYSRITLTGQHSKTRYQ